MATKTAVEVAQQLEQALNADAAVQSGARWKFPAEFRQEVQTTHSELHNTQQEIYPTKGTRRAASEQLKQDYEAASTIIRSVYNRIKGLSLNGPNLPLLVEYGFKAGVLGEFDQARVVGILNQFLTTSQAHNADSGALPEEWITEITQLKERIALNVSRAGVGERSALVELKSQKLKAAEENLSRLWHYLCYALPQRDQDPLMNNYGFTPRQDRRAKVAEAPPPSPPIAPTPAP